MINSNGSEASQRAFIGAVLNGDTRAGDHALSTEDFTDDLCRRTFAACVQLEAQGKQADIVTLFDAYPDIDSGELVTISAQALHGFMAEQYAANIRAAAQRKRLADLLVRSAQDAQDGAKPLEDTLAALRAQLDGAAAKSPASGLVSGTDALVNFALWLDGGEQDTAISTGLSRLDAKMNGGLRGGGLYVIGARTGVGKTALMLSMAISAIQAGKRVLFISLEMPEREDVSRMIASVSGVSLERIYNPKKLTDKDHIDIAEAYALLPGEYFQMCMTARTPQAVRRAALAMRAQGGLDLIVVDYIQIMQPDGKTNSRVETIGQITGALKMLAMELNVPVLTGSQVNRAGVQGGNEPRLSDLRESGSIEQDADVVLLLHRPDGQEREVRKRMQVLIAKNRQGSTGVCGMVFDGAVMRFYQTA